jgi:pimeloyl-ACP methyl ester carboxylesterase
VLVHGTFVGGPESFAAQAPLADRHRLLIVDRRGYGANPAEGDTLGWPVDGEDLLDLLEAVGGAHLVGHSYGGAVVAVAAGRRPDLVRSLVLVEPALHVLAAGHPAVAAMLEREREVFGQAPSMSAGDWSRYWLTRVAEALAEALVRRIGVEVVAFQGSAHLPQLEEPERFNDLLRAVWAVPEPGGKW